MIGESRNTSADSLTKKDAVYVSDTDRQPGAAAADRLSLVYRLVFELPVAGVPFRKFKFRCMVAASLTI
jgi:hypothetical protein